MMKKYSLFIIIILVVLTPVFSQGLVLKSNEFGGQITDQQVFNGFGCTGKNISPALEWENAPEGTKSFAITMYDPDAPTGSGWWHWVVFDIPANVHMLKSGAGSTMMDAMPKEAIQSLTDFGGSGYGGPCPPEGHGFHQYVITLHALEVDKLGLDASASPALVGFYLHANTIEKASLVAYYQR